MTGDPVRRFPGVARLALHPGTAAAALLTLALAWVPAGCATSISDRNLTMVDPAETRRLLEERRSLLGLGGTSRGACVDPRDEAAYRKGHIPGAIHLPFELVSTDNRALRNYDVLIVYGDDYNDERAIGMSKRLMELGFKEVRTLRGGLRAWTEAGMDLQKGE
jgi:rhodanese-related sulfurtransferase